MLPATARAENLPATWDKGFNFSSPSEYGSAAASTSLDGLASTGANAITIMPTWYQPALNSNAMAVDSQAHADRRGDEDRRRACEGQGFEGHDQADGRLARRLARRICSHSAVDVVRNYQKMINRYADFARNNKADALSIGVEFRSLTVPAHDVRWRTIIKGVRARFSGQLIYAANFDEYQQIRWWDAIDVIGIDAYFPPSNGVTPSEDEIAQRWQTFTDSAGVVHRYADEIAAVAARFSWPVMLAELGYPSTPNNMITPWDIGSVYSASEQQRAYVGASRRSRTRAGSAACTSGTGTRTRPGAPPAMPITRRRASPPADGHRLVLTRSASEARLRAPGHPPGRPLRIPSRDPADLP